MTSSPSEDEARWYYRGLPSFPLLVARSNAITSQFVMPTGNWAAPPSKELRPVGNHALIGIWEDNLALKIHGLLDTMKVKWTSTDVVRLRNTEDSSSPVIIWIGVIPASLSGEDGFVVASQCRKILEENGITDVEVEIRESIVTRSAGPKLLPRLDSSSWSFFREPSEDFRESLSTTLGIPICAHSTRWAEGMGGFFIAEGDNTKRLLLVTARHVVFPPDNNKNVLFENKNDIQPRHNVMLLGDIGFKCYQESIQTKIRSLESTIRYNRERITRHGQEMGAEERKKAQSELDRAREDAESLGKFYREVLEKWSSPENRIIGHVVLSPPIDIGVGSECYTEDWAVVEIDPSKIDEGNFGGNAVDLGDYLGAVSFFRKMSRDHEDLPLFEVPHHSPLKLKGTIPDEEMRCERQQCLMVIKRGHATGLTAGRANNVYSYVRNYFDDNTTKTSKEWAILPLASKSQPIPFSDKGDSGCVIVDALGRIGGLLTGGAGGTSIRDILSPTEITYAMDISYATPINHIIKSLAENGLHEPNVNPVLTWFIADNYASIWTVREDR